MSRGIIRQKGPFLNADFFFLPKIFQRALSPPVLRPLPSKLISKQKQSFYFPSTTTMSNQKFPLLKY